MVVIGEAAPDAVDRTHVRRTITVDGARAARGWRSSHAVQWRERGMARVGNVAGTTCKGRRRAGGGSRLNFIYLLGKCPCVATAPNIYNQIHKTFIKII
jgi:hypothetical protein